jgi:hypothetical protein
MSDDKPAEEAPRPSAVDDGGEPQAAPEPAEDSSAAPQEKPARKPKKKKRRRPDPEATLASTDRPRPDVPAFALSFPVDPALDELVTAFDQGDYARVRREAPRLAKRTSRPEVRRAARELEKRLNPDPLSVYLLVAASLLLLFLATWYWTHPHEAP